MRVPSRMISDWRSPCARCISREMYSHNLDIYHLPIILQHVAPNSKRNVTWSWIITLDTLHYLALESLESLDTLKSYEIIVQVRNLSKSISSSMLGRSRSCRITWHRRFCRSPGPKSTESTAVDSRQTRPPLRIEAKDFGCGAGLNGQIGQDMIRHECHIWNYLNTSEYLKDSERKYVQWIVCANLQHHGIISRWTAGSRAGTVSSDFTPCWQISGWTASRVTVHHSLSFDNFDSYKSFTLLFHQAVLASRHGRCCQGFTEPFQPNLECHSSGWQRQPQATGTLNHADMTCQCKVQWSLDRRQDENLRDRPCVSFVTQMRLLSLCRTFKLIAYLMESTNA